MILRADEGQQARDEYLFELVHRIGEVTKISRATRLSVDIGEDAPDKFISMISFGVLSDVLRETACELTSSYRFPVQESVYSEQRFAVSAWQAPVNDTWRSSRDVRGTRLSKGRQCFQA